MAVTADSVVVELEAKVAGYNAAIADAANKTDAAFSRIGSAVDRAAERRARLARQVGASEDFILKKTIENSNNVISISDTPHSCGCEAASAM